MKQVVDALGKTGIWTLFRQAEQTISDAVFLHDIHEIRGLK